MDPLFTPVTNKPFTSVLAEDVTYDPNQSALMNVGHNLARAGDKVIMRNRWQDRAIQMEQAMEKLRQEQAIARRRAAMLKIGRLQEQLGAIVDEHDYDAWRKVPEMVVALFKKAAPIACRLAAWADRAAGPEDRLWWHGDSNTAWAEIADTEKRADWEALPDVPGVPGLALFIEPFPPPPVEGWLMVKAADGYLEPLAKPHHQIQQMMAAPFGAKPNGLTSAILNGVLGGGLGYGAGWLADQFLPEEHFQKGRLAKTLGLAGAGLGAIPGLWRYSAEVRGQNYPPYNGGPGPLPRIPHKDIPNPWGYPGSLHPDTDLSPQLPPPPPKNPLQPFGTTSPFDANGTKLASVHPWLHKAAEDYGTGAMFLQTIPVDAFNQAIWNDVEHPPNRFGTKSPWGNNEQPMGTPPYAAAAISGLLAGTAQAVGSGAVSPLQVAAAAAMGAGKGWVTGMAAGKILGAMAGLKPESQQKLQSLGLLGGLITGVANSLYR